MRPEALLYVSLSREIEGKREEVLCELSFFSAQRWPRWWGCGWWQSWQFWQSRVSEPKPANQRLILRNDFNVFKRLSRSLLARSRAPMSATHPRMVNCSSFLRPKRDLDLTSM